MAKKPGLPLKPERKIEFTTDEGTWLSLTVTPDGKSIVFELAGHLYALPIAGGEAKAITSGMAFDSQPAVSPDGKWLAFISDRDGADNVWIAKIDGTEPKQLSKEKHSDMQSPSWAPDGDYVLVSRTPAQGPHEIWMYHVDGGTGVQVTRNIPTSAAPNAPPPPANQRTRAQGAVASPDGKYIYFARRTGMFSYNVTFPLWQIVRRDRTTGDEDIITSSPGSAFRPVISPDGTKLIYGTRFDTETGLRIRDLATGEEKWLRYPVQRDDQESMASRDVLPGYAFTPDSKDVIVSYGGKIHRIQTATGEAADIPFTAQVTAELGPQLKFASRVEEGPSARAWFRRRRNRPMASAWCSLLLRTFTQWICRTENRCVFRAARRVNTSPPGRQTANGSLTSLGPMKAASSGRCGPMAAKLRSS